MRIARMFSSRLMTAKEVALQLSLTRLGAVVVKRTVVGCS